MNNKPKTIDILNVKYAMASELDENYNLLERLVSDGKVGKVVWNGQNYYEVSKVQAHMSSMRTVPEGYVRATDHATLLGVDIRTAARVCSQRNALAKKIQVGDTRPAWFADKAWLEKQLGYVAPETPARVTRTKGTIVNPPSSSDRAIRELQKTIGELRKTIEGIVRPGIARPTETPTETDATLRAKGYRPLQELTKELEVSSSTMRGWYVRGAVRYLRLGGTAYLNVQDTERMFLNLDTNRAVVAARMGRRTNNSLATRNGAS